MIFFFFRAVASRRSGMGAANVDFFIKELRPIVLLLLLLPLYYSNNNDDDNNKIIVVHNRHDILELKSKKVMQINCLPFQLSQERK